MSFPKVLLVVIGGLFSLIAIAALIKGGRGERMASGPVQSQPIALSSELIVAPAASPAVTTPGSTEIVRPAVVLQAPSISLPDADRMEEFFNVGEPKLPIVETLVYSRKVPWLQGKAAWVVDYATHYETSRHLIARSLNGMRNYDDQRVANGDRFNVFRKERPVSFHLVVDTSRCRMWVYYLDELSDERVLVKSYPVGLGRRSDKKASGLLTPHGTYQLGDNIAVYREGAMGLHDGQRIPMRQVFGTRWIPFGAEVGQCTSPPKGLGLHGCPWTAEGKEDLSGLSEYASDGCIRLSTEDIEELFSVIITKPTRIYIVPDFFKAELPGKESAQIALNS